jgi:hypothetical protein
LEANSRVLWLTEGDKNTKFFHKMADSNRRRNTIDSLVIDGTNSTNQAGISEHIVHYYKMYIEQCDWRPLVDDLSFDSIDDVEASWLEREIEEWEVVKAINGDKASGPNVSLWCSFKLVGLFLKKPS